MPLNIKLGEDVPITVPQGTSFTRILRCKNKESGLRISLAGYEGRSQVRKSKKITEDNLLIEFEVTVSQVSDITNPDCGKIIWHVGAIESEKMVQKGYYNIELYDPLDLDNVVRLFQGPVNADPDVTV